MNAKELIDRLNTLIDAGLPPTTEVRVVRGFHTFDILRTRMATNVIQDDIPVLLEISS